MWIGSSQARSTGRVTKLKMTGRRRAVRRHRLDAEGARHQNEKGYRHMAEQK